MNEAQFRADLEAQGYTIHEVHWEANRVNDSHAHDFDARLMCCEGSVEISLPDAKHACKPGVCIEVPAGTVHREVVGPQGARLIAGRK